MSQRRVLIVDDEVDVCKFLEYFFENKGYETKYTTEGLKVAEIVKSYSPHVILLDLKMPDMNGLEVLEEVRSFDKKVGVIVVTGWLDEDIGRKALKFGASDFIAKPIDLDYLENSVLAKVVSMLG